jgi:phage-related holin
MTKTLTAIGISLTGFFAPLTTAFTVAIFLVFLDTFSKVIVVGKTQGIGAIKSRKLYRVVPKTIFYMIFIILGQLCHDFIDVEIPFQKLVLVGIIGIEVYSIDENFEELTGFSFIKRILEFTKKITQIKSDRQ